MVLLASEVQLQMLWWRAHQAMVDRLREAVLEDPENGSVWDSTVFIAACVAAAIAIGGVLWVKFQQKAESIDTTNPTGPPAN